MKRVTFHEEADAEAIEAARFYEAKAPGLGLSFLLEVEDSVDRELVSIVCGRWLLFAHRLMMRTTCGGLPSAVKTRAK